MKPAQQPPPPASARRPRAAAGMPLALVLIGAALLLLSFPPYDLGWLGWLAPAPLLAIALGPWRRPALWGALGGLLFLLPHLTWLIPFSPVGWALAAFLCALWYGLALGLGRRAAMGLAPFWQPAAVAAAWTAAEWARSLGPLGFTWGHLAISQHRFPAALQLLDLTGSLGLTFLMAWLAAALVGLALFGERRAGAGFALAAGVTLLVLARGFALLAAPPPAGEMLPVAVVQGSTSHVSETPHTDVRSTPEDYFPLTHAAAQSDPALIVWGEGVTWEDPLLDEPFRRQLGALTSRHRTRLLVGNTSLSPAGRHNTALLFGPEGEIADRYDKVFLVPMGEYVPLRRYWPPAWVAAAPRPDMVPGPGYFPVEEDGLRVGIAICFESAFGRIPRAHVREGAAVLAFMTSDGWAGRENAALQHEAMAPLRAVETRRGIVRAANAGVSSLIDPSGRRLATLPLFTQGHLAGELPLRDDLTLYVRLGDWPGWLAALFVVLLCLRRRRELGVRS